MVVQLFKKVKLILLTTMLLMFMGGFTSLASEATFAVKPFNNMFQVYMDWWNVDSKATNIQWVEENPESHGLHNLTISTGDSDVPIYAAYNPDTTTIELYTTADKVYLNEDSSYFLYNYTTLTNIEFLENVDESKVKNMDYMFYNLNSVTSLEPIKDWDTSNVTSMQVTFYQMSGLTSFEPLRGWNVSNVTNMRHLFNHTTGINSLEPLKNWNVSNVTNLHATFNRMTGLESLEGLENWDVSSVTDMGNIFGGEDSVTSAPTNGAELVTSLEPIANWDTSSVTNMQFMFYGMRGVASLEPLRAWNTSNVESLNATFYGMTSITDLEPIKGWDTSKVNRMSWTFEYMTNLESLEGIKNWDVSSVESMDSLIFKCEKIDDLTPLQNWNTQNLNNMNYAFGSTGLIDTSGLENWDLLSIQSNGTKELFQNIENNIKHLNIAPLTENSDYTKICTVDKYPKYICKFTPPSKYVMSEDDFNFLLKARSVHSMWKVVGDDDNSYERSELYNLYKNNVEANLANSTNNIIIFELVSASFIGGYTGNYYYASNFRNKINSLCNYSDITEIRWSNEAPNESITTVNVDDSDSGAIKAWVDGTTVYLYTSADKVFMPEDSSYFLYEFSKLQNLDFLSNVDSSDVKTLHCAFSKTSSITSLEPLENWDTSNVTDLGSTFYGMTGVSSLKGLENWNTSNVRTLYSTFSTMTNLESLEYLQNWDVSKVTDLTYAFNKLSNITSLKGLENWDTSSVTEIYYTFSDMTKVESLEALTKWNTSNINKLYYAFNNMSAVTSLKGLENWDVTNVTNLYYTFSGMSNVTNIESLKNWNISNMTKLYHAFHGMSKVESIEPLENWDTSNVANMEGLFSGMSSITSIKPLENWDTSSVTNLDSIFSNMSSVTSLEGIEDWNISKVTGLNSLFKGMSSVTDLEPIRNWDISNIKSLNNTFYEMSGLTSLEALSNWDTSNITSLYGTLFKVDKVTSLEPISRWDVSNVTDMSCVFENMSNVESLEPISDWDVSKVTNLRLAFYGMSNVDSLEPISNWNVSNVTSLSNTFNGMSKIENIDALKNWNPNNLKDVSSVFSDMSSLKNTDGIQNWDLSHLNYGYSTSIYGYDNKTIEDLNMAPFMHEYCWIYMFYSQLYKIEHLKTFTPPVRKLMPFESFKYFTNTDDNTKWAIKGESNILSASEAYNIHKTNVEDNLDNNTKNVVTFVKIPKITYNLNNGVKTESDDKYPSSYIPGSTITVGDIGTVSREGYYFTGWTVNNDTTLKVNSTDVLISPDTTGDITLTANWVLDHTEAVFKTRNNLKSTKFYTKREYIKSIVWEDEIPEGTSTEILSTSETDTNVYGWYTSDNVYHLYTEADKVFLNPDSSYWLYEFYDLEDVKFLSRVDASKVTTMYEMFWYAKSIKSLEGTEHFKTPNLTDVTWLLDNCYELEDASALNNWDFSHVTSGSYIFYGCSELKDLGLKTFNSSCSVSNDSSNIIKVTLPSKYIMSSNDFKSSLLDNNSDGTWRVNGEALSLDDIYTLYSETVTANLENGTDNVIVMERDPFVQVSLNIPVNIIEAPLYCDYPMIVDVENNELYNEYHEYSGGPISIRFNKIFGENDLGEHTYRFKQITPKDNLIDPSDYEVGAPEEDPNVDYDETIYELTFRVYIDPDEGLSYEVTKPVRTININNIYKDISTMTSVFLSGNSFNEKIVHLVGYSVDINPNEETIGEVSVSSKSLSYVTNIKWVDSLPDDFGEYSYNNFRATGMSTSNTSLNKIYTDVNAFGLPIYAWLDGTELCLYTRANHVYLNNNSAYMLENFTSIPNVDFLSNINSSISYFNADTVTSNYNGDRISYYEGIPDTSGNCIPYNTQFMFSNTKSLTDISALKDWLPGLGEVYEEGSDEPTLEDIGYSGLRQGMFAGSGILSNEDIDGWNVPFNNAVGMYCDSSIKSLDVRDYTSKSLYGFVDEENYTGIGLLFRNGNTSESGDSPHYIGGVRDVNSINNGLTASLMYNGMENETMSKYSSPKNLVKFTPPSEDKITEDEFKFIVSGNNWQYGHSDKNEESRTVDELYEEYSNYDGVITFYKDYKVKIHKVIDVEIEDTTIPVGEFSLSEDDEEIDRIKVNNFTVASPSEIATSSEINKNTSNNSVDFSDIDLDSAYIASLYNENINIVNGNEAPNSDTGIEYSIGDEIELRYFALRPAGRDKIGPSFEPVNPSGSLIKLFKLNLALVKNNNTGSTALFLDNIVTHERTVLNVDEHEDLVKLFEIFHEKYVKLSDENHIYENEDEESKDHLTAYLTNEFEVIGYCSEYDYETEQEGLNNYIRQYYGTRVSVPGDIYQVVDDVKNFIDVVGSYCIGDSYSEGDWYDKYEQFRTPEGIMRAYLTATSPFGSNTEILEEIMSNIDYSSIGRRELADIHTYACDYILRSSLIEKVLIGTAPKTPNIVFDKEFTADDAGTHTYTLQQIAPDNKYDYDDTEFVLTVEVNINDYGEVEVNIDTPEIVLRNRIKDNVVKETINIISLNDKAPLGKFKILNEVGKLVGTYDVVDNKIDFKWKYTKDDIGSHTFVIKQMKGSDNNCVYDDTEYMMVIDIYEDDEEGLTYTADIPDIEIENTLKKESKATKSELDKATDSEIPKDRGKSDDDSDNKSSGNKGKATKSELDRDNDDNNDDENKSSDNKSSNKNDKSDNKHNDNEPDSENHYTWDEDFDPNKEDEETEEEREKREEKEAKEEEKERKRQEREDNAPSYDGDFIDSIDYSNQNEPLEKGKVKFRMTNGMMLKNEIKILPVHGRTGEYRIYMFDNNGDLVHGWAKDPNTHAWKYFGEDGAEVFGWHKINGKWYFFNNNMDSILRGEMVLNCEVDGHYIGPDGALVEDIDPTVK